MNRPSSMLTLAWLTWVGCTVPAEEDERIAESKSEAAIGTPVPQELDECGQAGASRTDDPCHDDCAGPHAGSASCSVDCPPGCGPVCTAVSWADGESQCQTGCVDFATGAVCDSQSSCTNNDGEHQCPGPMVCGNRPNGGGWSCCDYLPDQPGGVACEGDYPCGAPPFNHDPTQPPQCEGATN